jgi:hypothetical protein
MTFEMMKMCANLSEYSSFVSLQNLPPNPQSIILFFSSENHPSHVHYVPLTKSIFLLLNESEKPYLQNDGGTILILTHLMISMVKIKRPQLKLFITLTL